MEEIKIKVAGKNRHFSRESEEPEDVKTFASCSDKSGLAANNSTVQETNINGSGNFFIPREIWELLKEKEHTIHHKDRVIHELLCERAIMIAVITKLGGEVPKYHLPRYEYFDK